MAPSTPLPRITPPVDPRETAARRFPLVPRAKPPCPPLTVRLEQIRTRAHTAANGTDQSLLSAAQAHNLAALTMSDCGLPACARQLCMRQATLFLTAQPLDAATAKLALQPLINMGRLLIRDGDGAAAYRLFDQLFTAVKEQTSIVIGGTTIDLHHLTASTADHHEAVTWLWSVLLADGTRALAQAGQWTHALQHAHRHKAIGKRLLDGRQIAIAAHSAIGDHDTARELLVTADTPTPWEKTAAAALALLCRSRAHQATAPALAALMGHYLASDDDPEREHAVFRTRIGLVVLDLADHVASVQRVTDTLVGEALSAKDAYLARDILAHHASAAHLDGPARRPLQALVDIAGLGRGSFCAEIESDLRKSVQTSEKALRKALHRGPGRAT